MELQVLKRVVVVESRTCRDFSFENHDVEVWRMRYIQTITWEILKGRIQRWG
jgi:hypothetical protein